MGEIVLVVMSEYYSSQILMLKAYSETKRTSEGGFRPSELPA